MSAVDPDASAGVRYAARPHEYKILAGSPHNGLSGW